MAFVDTTWYCNAGDQSTTGHYAVPVFQVAHTYAAGDLLRQLTAPAVGSERVFVCIVAGLSVAEPTWTVTRGAKNTSTTPVFQECTGASAVNGDVTNTQNWTTVKNTVVTLGQIIKRNNAASYQICSTGGTAGNGSEPAFSDTAGTTTADNTVTWTSLGVVGNFAGGGAPHARIQSACASTWFASGSTVYIGDNSAESQATAITITPSLGATLISRVLCHNHSGSYPPASTDLTTGATLSTTANASITLTGSNGGLYYYGVTFKAGVGASGSASIIFGETNAYSVYDNCGFWTSTTSATAGLLQVNSTNCGFMVWNNCTVKFGSVSHTIDPGTVQWIWQNTGQILASGSSVPSQLVVASANARLCNVLLEALDLSQLTGAITGSATYQMGNIAIKDCKLNASATITSPAGYGGVVNLLRSASGATPYVSSRYAYEAAETTETTITRVGGATDPSGQAQTRKIVTTSTALWHRPYRAEPYAVWNSTVSSNVTVTVCGTINSASLPNNDDIWMEVEYLGSAGSPVGTIVTTTKSNTLAANAAVASDSSTWNGGGSGAGWSPFKLTTTLSSPQPGLAGYLLVRVRAGKASTTYYIDPQITLT